MDNTEKIILYTLVAVTAIVLGAVLGTHVRLNRLIKANNLKTQ